MSDGTPGDQLLADMQSEKVLLVDMRSELMLSIDQSCALQISNDEGIMELDHDQVMALGDFLHATRGLWRP